VSVKLGAEWDHARKRFPRVFRAQLLPLLERTRGISSARGPPRCEGEQVHTPHVWAESSLERARGHSKHTRQNASEEEVNGWGAQTSLMAACAEK
jgi:hypothetical protein